MSESIELIDPLYKLVVRFGNGEMVHHFMTELIDSRMIQADTRYAVVSCFPILNPSQCTEVNVINLRDVTFIKSERVTLNELHGERRMAGIRAADSDDKLPKTLAQLKFI